MHFGNGEFEEVLEKWNFYNLAEVCPRGDTIRVFQSTIRIQ